MNDSTTGAGDGNTGEQSGSLPEPNTGKPAEQQGDAASGGNTQDGADQGGDNSQEQSKPSDDDGLAQFAKGQGIDNLDDLTDRERKLLKVAQDNQKEFHKKRQDEAETLRKSVAELHDPAKAAEGVDDPAAKERLELRAEMNQLKQYQRVNEFWRQNPDAKDYEADMNRLVLEEKEKYGLDSAIYLSKNLDRLYKLAKADRQDPDSLREAGRREERQELRRKQEGSADSGSASVQSSRSNGKVDASWIENTYDPSNAEHRKMLDAYLAGSR